MQTIEIGEREMPEGVGIRELRPGDYGAYFRFEQRLEPEDLRLRFGHPVRPSENRAHDSRMRGEEFIAIDGKGEIIGAACLVDSEVGLIVRSDMKRRRKGTALLNRIVERAIEEGVPELRGFILSENRPMAALARRAAFRFERYHGTAFEVRMRLPSMPSRAWALPHETHSVRIRHAAAGGRHG
jgi:hypothetical protein